MYPRVLSPRKAAVAVKEPAVERVVGGDASGGIRGGTPCKRK